MPTIAKLASSRRFQQGVEWTNLCPANLDLQRLRANATNQGGQGSLLCTLLGEYPLREE